MAGNLLSKAAEAQQRAQALRLEAEASQGGAPQGQPPGPPAGNAPPGQMPPQGAPPPPPQEQMPTGAALPGEDPSAEAGDAPDFEGPSFNGEEASADEQREYERALSSLYKVLYSNDKTHQSIVQGLKSTPQNKIEPVVKMGVLLVKQLDEKVDLHESVIAQITGDTVDRMIEIAETRYGAQYSDTEAQRALGATWEGVMMMFGITEEDFQRGMQGLSQEDVFYGKQVYQGALGRSPKEGGAANG